MSDTGLPGVTSEDGPPAMQGPGSVPEDRRGPAGEAWLHQHSAWRIS